jgi:predicted secreted Zn-dependent protease
VRALFFALLLGAAQGTWAQFKCVSPEGKVSYSEHPCAGAAKPQAISRGATSTPAIGAGASALAPPSETKTGYYDVQGSDLRSLLASLNARGQHHGRAVWKLGYKFKQRQGAGVCQVESLSTELELVMTLPRWSPPAGAAASLVASWERYVAALRVHEEGHLEHGRGAERDFRAVAASLSAPDCAALDQALRQLYASILSDYQVRDTAYDARTEHGKSQGAWLR